MTVTDFLSIEPLAKYPSHLGEVAFFAVLIERCLVLQREGAGF
jgi:hypothetical protein